MRMDAKVTRIIAAGQAAIAISKSNTAEQLATQKAEIDEKNEEEKKAKKKEDAKVQKKIQDIEEAGADKLDPDDIVMQYAQIDTLTNQKAALETQLLELQEKFKKQEDELNKLKLTQTEASS